MAHPLMLDVCYVNEGNIIHHLDSLYLPAALNHWETCNKHQDQSCNFGNTRPGLLSLIFDSPCLVIPKAKPYLSLT